jgi:hypothetical protein
MTGEVGEGKYEGLKVARFRQWVVDRAQPIFDDLAENYGAAPYDVGATKIYVGGGRSYSPDFGTIILETPGGDPGNSFFRTGASILHELGHQGQMAIYGGYSNFMDVWRPQYEKYGDPGMYYQPGTLEWRADRFRDNYMGTLLR